MSKQAISVTLHRDNLLWLRGRAHAMKRRSISELLDQLITEARTGGREVGPVRSVKGSIRISDDDPNLEKADEYLRSLFTRKQPKRQAGQAARRRSHG